MLQKTPKPVEAPAAPKPFAIEMDRDGLVAALKLLEKAINKRSKIPVIGHVLMRHFATTKNVQWCELIVTDLDQRVRHLVKYEGDRIVDFTLPCLGLAKALSQLCASIIGIGVNPREHRVTIGAAGAELAFDTLHPEDFPAPRTVSAPPHKYLVKGSDLLGLIRNVNHAISTEETRYYLKGAFFHCLQDGILRATTTDGHRMAIDELPTEGIVKAMPGVIVPVGVEAHCRAFTDNAVTITSAADGITFDFGDGVIIDSKVIDGTYPDYARVIPEKNELLALVDNADLDTALRQFPTKGRKPFQKRAVSLAFLNDRITLSMEGGDGPAVKQHIACEYQGEAFTIGFNPGFLRDALSVLGDTVGIAMGRDGEPALLMSDEWPRCILMPMRH